MDLEELERLVEMVQHAGIRGLTLREGSSRVTIRKTLRARTGANALVAAPSSDWRAGDAVITEFDEEPRKSEDARQTVVVPAPAVGVFRHVKPAVGLAAGVKAGQLMGQIEAPRLVNEVIAPASGLVVDVCTEDGMPVEYGQPLFVLDVERSVE